MNFLFAICESFPKKKREDKVLNNGNNLVKRIEILKLKEGEKKERKRELKNT